MKTIEEAVEHQLEIHKQVDEGTYKLSEMNFRSASLKDGYEMKWVPEYGTGMYPVNIETGEVCEWNGKWFADGTLLMCQDCFLEGT